MPARQRYVVSFPENTKDKTVSSMQDDVTRYGGRRIRLASASRQMFCDLDEEGLKRLMLIPGIKVQKVGEVRPLVTPNVYGSIQANTMAGVYYLRNAFDPPVLGTGVTIAVLDSGIRRSHYSLLGKVVHEDNFSSSPTLDDVYDHGTGVAYVCAGGRNAPGEESGFAPGAYLMNIKVLDDNGIGTDETIVNGIEEVIRLDEEAVAQGLPLTDPMNIGLINVSWGKPDDGNISDPIRVALRKAVEEQNIIVIAAAGDGGPGAGTIFSPACDSKILACGAMTFSPLDVWELSSRGPSKEGIVKPDVAGFGVNMLVASSLSDSSYTIKSGTSYSAPTLTGALALLWEIIARMSKNPNYHPDIEVIKSMIPRFTVKPSGYPREKDNSIGWGTFSGQAIVNALSGAGLAQIIPAFLALGMMIPVSKAVSTMSKKGAK